MRHLDAPAPDVVEGMFREWPRLVGDVIARNSRTRRIRDGELQIEVNNPARASELQWMSEEILSRVSSLLETEEITSVSVTLAK